MKNWKLSTKLHAASLILIAVAVLIGTIGITGIRKTNAGLETVYNDRVVPLEQLKLIADDYAVLIIDAANKANGGVFTAEEALRSVNSADERIHKTWKDYRATYLTPEETKLAEEAEQLFGPANAAVARLREFLGGKTGSLKGKLDEFDGPLYAHIDPISGKITELVDLQLRVAKEEYTAAHARFESVLWLSIITLVAGILAGGGIGWMVIRNATLLLRRVSSSLSQSGAQNTVAAHEVASASQSLAEGASEQAASLEETSASMEEMSSTTKRNAENSQKANALAKQARAAADAGATDMQAMTAAMEAIKISSDDIAKIIRTIDEIAFQTNILALNAAVEAARAGEAGMGFAVVADEVRNLAQRSAQAAKETAAKIESAIGNTTQGVEISSKVVKTLQEIVTEIRQVDELAAEVAVASGEQTQGMSQINIAVSQLEKVTQSNAANAEESAAAAEELNAQALGLNQIVVELQQLVDGGTTSPREAEPPQAKPQTKTESLWKRTSSPAAPDKTHRNGNGHAQANVQKTAFAPRGTTPSAGDFMDF